MWWISSDLEFSLARAEGRDDKQKNHHDDAIDDGSIKSDR